jgi:hypothetical protein
VASAVFVYRSFYGMRIGGAPAGEHEPAEPAEPVEPGVPAADGAGGAGGRGVADRGGLLPRQGAAADDDGTLVDAEGR